MTALGPVPDAGEADALVRLAESHGVMLAYRDVDDELQVAGREQLLAVLRTLGVPITAPGEAERLLAHLHRQRWTRPLEPVVATFDGHYIPVELRLPERLAAAEIRLRLTHESGEEHTWTQRLAEADRSRAADVDGERYLGLAAPVRGVPWGYHDLEVEIEGEVHRAMLTVAPARAYGADERRRDWGAFLPLYALRTERDWGVGDLTDLAELGAMIADAGGTVVGTLPLLPVYLGGRTAGGADAADVTEPFEPSPYSPVSRLFWNELFIDVAHAPELERSQEARDLLGSGSLAGELEDVRATRIVDYPGVAERKGHLLRMLAATFFAGDTSRLDQLLSERPEVADYARFRGAVARHGAAWQRWPQVAARGELRDRDVDQEIARLHLYAQLLAHEQIAELTGDLRSRGLQPYLDLPIGTRRDGYDVWRHRDVFAVDADTGAPPDTIFTGGQNWRFPPLHPQGLREDRYRYLRATLAHHLALADVLRVDHVMGFHRLFWIPQEVDAKQGVYVRYPADEWYAVASLESHRHTARLIGEDLGTVPEEVDATLLERGVGRMYVVQYEAQPGRYDVLDPVPEDSLASVNTHDMPPFARWWRADDVDDQVELGLMDDDEAGQARAERARIRSHLVALLVGQGRLRPDTTDDAQAVHAALLEWLGAGDAPLVLATLEDLWLEPDPQNTPGTTSEERPNWRRRAALTLEEMRSREDVTGQLERLDTARREESR
jgi:4-alpha-glucanotransferase